MFCDFIFFSKRNGEVASFYTRRKMIVHKEQSILENSVAKNKQQIRNTQVKYILYFFLDLIRAQSVQMNVILISLNSSIHLHVPDQYFFNVGLLGSKDYCKDIALHVYKD